MAELGLSMSVIGNVALITYYIAVTRTVLTGTVKGLAELKTEVSKLREAAVVVQLIDQRVTGLEGRVDEHGRRMDGLSGGGQ